MRHKSTKKSSGTGLSHYKKKTGTILPGAVKLNQELAVKCSQIFSLSFAGENAEMLFLT